MARQLTNCEDGILLGKRYLILDRDTKYCSVFRDFVKREGVVVIRLPPRSPNLNAYAERWVRGARDQCLSKLVPIGQGMLWRALREYEPHFHHERNHQGLGNVLVMPQVSSTRRLGPVIRHPRLGALLNYYEQAAA
jgi:transposase InsO family protein